MLKKRNLSAFPFFLNPSAMFAATDTEDLFTCDVVPYNSSFGKAFVILYTPNTNS